MRRKWLWWGKSMQVRMIEALHSCFCSIKLCDIRVLFIPCSHIRSHLPNPSRSLLSEGQSWLNRELHPISCSPILLLSHSDHWHPSPEDTCCSYLFYCTPIFCLRVKELYPVLKNGCFWLLIGCRLEVIFRSSLSSYPAIDCHIDLLLYISLPVTLGSSDHLWMMMLSYASHT